jgi:hypothetical protein
MLLDLEHGSKYENFGKFLAALRPNCGRNLPKNTTIQSFRETQTDLSTTGQD